MRATYVRPEGDPATATWAIVGEQPGKTEIMSGKPFQGPAGRELNSCLGDAKLSRREGYLTNVIKDYDHTLQHYIEIGKNGAVSVSVLGQQYLEELTTEINSLSKNCRCIVACGNVALWALTGRLGVTKWRGSILQSQLGVSFPVVPIIHPATIAPPKNQYLNKHLITNDLQRVKTIVDGTYVATQRELIINPTYTESVSYLEYIISLGDKIFQLAYDIEITNLQVSCISFALNANEAISIPFLNASGDMMTIAEETHIWRLIAQILEDPKIPKVGQNISFDSHFLLRRYGIRVENMEDTMVAQQILMGDYPKGLDFITSIWTDHPYYKQDGKDWFKGKGTYERFWQYNATDSIVCAEAFPKQMTALIKQGNVDTYERQRLTIAPLIYMQEHGIRCDVAGLHKHRLTLEQEMCALQEELNSLAGMPLNINSPKQLKEFFYITRGFKPYVKRGSGTIAVDKLALKRLARKGSQEANIILELRKRAKQVSTYLDVDKIDSDGRLRCNYNPVGTRFSRLSSSKSIFGTGMNTQNISHDVLAFFLADEGYVYYSYDLSQAENRIVAYVGNIPEMIDAFESGKDVHRLTASLIFGKPYDEISAEEGSSPFNDGKSERDWGKRANHGLNYDLGYRSFAIIYEMAENDAKRIVDGYHLAYPGVRQGFHTHVRSSLQKNRIVTNLMGRRTLFLEAWGDSLFKEAYACIPQGTVGDVVNERGLCFIYYTPLLFSPVELLIQVHDSIGFQLPLTLPWRQHAAILQEIKNSLELPLTTHYGREFKIPTDLMMGISLSKKEGVEIKDKNWPVDLDTLADTLAKSYEKLSKARVE